MNKRKQKKSAMSSPSDNAKMDIQIYIHTQVDMRGSPDRYPANAGREP